MRRSLLSSLMNMSSSTSSLSLCTGGGEIRCFFLHGWGLLYHSSDSSYMWDFQILSNLDSSSLWPRLLQAVDGLALRHSVRNRVYTMHLTCIVPLIIIETVEFFSLMIYSAYEDNSVYECQLVGTLWHTMKALWILNSFSDMSYLPWKRFFLAYFWYSLATRQHLPFWGIFLCLIIAYVRHSEV